MKKELFISMLACSLAAVSLNAADTTATNTSAKDLELGLSTMYDSLTGTFAPELNLNWSWLETGVYANYHRHNTTSTEGAFNVTHLGGHVGFRMDVVEKLSASIGAMGYYGFVGGRTSSVDASKPFTVGAYVGFNYRVAPKVEVFTRIMPYAYERTEHNANLNQVFSKGQVGLTWFFY